MDCKKEAIQVEMWMEKHILIIFWILFGKIIKVIWKRNWE